MTTKTVEVSTQTPVHGNDCCGLFIVQEFSFFFPGEGAGVRPDSEHRHQLEVLHTVVLLRGVQHARQPRVQIQHRQLREAQQPVQLRLAHRHTHPNTPIQTTLFFSGISLVVANVQVPSGI